MKASGSHTSNWRMFGRDLNFELRLIDWAVLDTKEYVRPEDFFLDADRRRRLSRLGDQKFEARTVPLDEVPFEVSSAESRAEELVWHNDIVFCDRQNRVFLNHDIVKLASLRNQKRIFVCRFKCDLSEAERIGLILRKLSKSSEFPTMARIETIRYAVDELGWTPETVFSLMVSKGKNKFSKLDVVNEYRTAKIYEEFCDFVTPVSNYSLSDHPNTFSRIKYLVGKKDIREDMDSGRDRREHWVNMAIMTTVTGAERFQDNVNRIMNYPRPKQSLFEGSYTQALSELKSRHPEADKKSFPHYDLVAANEKFQSDDNIRLIAGQIKRNPEGHPTLNVILNMVNTLASSSPEAFERIVRTLAQIDQQKLVRLTSALQPVDAGMARRIR